MDGRFQTKAAYCRDISQCLSMVRKAIKTGAAGKIPKSAQMRRKKTKIKYRLRTTLSCLKPLPIRVIFAWLDFFAKTTNTRQ